MKTNKNHTPLSDLLHRLILTDYKKTNISVNTKLLKPNKFNQKYNQLNKISLHTLMIAYSDFTTCLLSNCILKYQLPIRDSYKEIGNRQLKAVFVNQNMK